MMIRAVETAFDHLPLFDALIIGGGPAGATAALTLARAGWSVAVVEKSVFPRRKVCGEFISATSMQLLRKLGVAEAFLALAGPAVRRVGLHAGDTILAADMPCPRDAPDQYGRALGREHLDLLLLSQAAKSGAAVMQPCEITGVEPANSGFLCTLAARDRPQVTTLRARCVIAAHGSWERGALPTQKLHYPRCASDLFAFKAHFRNCDLPPDLMPLLVFPGGYGGMVRTDSGRTSLSCCIRRDALARCRIDTPQGKAALAVFAHIRASCRGIAASLARADLDGAWLSSGPIRPGIRSLWSNGIFSVGNVAGEAHPIVAEGISMAMQSAWLLCGHLIAHKDELCSPHRMSTVVRAYEAGWRRNFAPRIRMAAVFAHLAMRPATAQLALQLLKRVPALLTLGARLGGKAQLLYEQFD